MILAALVGVGCGGGEEAARTVERTVEVTRTVTEEVTVPAEPQAGPPEDAGAPDAGAERLPGPAVPAEIEETLEAGATAELDSGLSATVSNEDPDVPPGDAPYRPRAGAEFYVVEAEVCVSSAAGEPLTVDPRAFSLQASEDSFRIARPPVRRPAFENAPIPPGECNRGFVTFQVGEEETPEAVIFDGPQDVEWRFENG